MFKKKKDSQEMKPKTKKKGGKKKIIWIVAIVAIVLVIIIKTAAGSGDANVAMVQTAQVLKGDITQKIETSGTVASEESKTYFASTGATVDTVTAALGETVEKGQMLLTYDTTEMENEIKKVEYEAKISEIGADATLATINNSQKKAAQAAVNYEDAVKYVQHYTDCVNQANAQLAKVSELSDQQMSLQAEIKDLSEKLTKKPESEKLNKKMKEKQKALKQVEKELQAYNVKEIQNALEICSGDLAEYKALKERYEAEKETDPSAELQKAQQLTSKEASAFSQKLAQETLDEAKKGIVSEFDGIVSNVSVVEGQQTAPGAALFTIENSEKLKVTLSVSKYDLEKIAVGQKAKLTISGKEYEGTVSYVSKIAQTSASGAIMIMADVHIDNPDEAIVLGVEAKVAIETAQVNDAILVPLNSVNYASEGVFCYTVVDGKVKKQSVETGVSDDEHIQILSGLSVGDQVITNITSELQEDMPVVVMEETAEEEAEATQKEE